MYLYVNKKNLDITNDEYQLIHKKHKNLFYYTFFSQINEKQLEARLYGMV